MTTRNKCLELLLTRFKRSANEYRHLAAHYMAIVTLGMLASHSAHADPISDARKAIQARNLGDAIDILQRAADSGDVKAKSQLAAYLRNFPAPHRDVERGCKLAIEAADMGDSMGMVTRAECVLAGTEKSSQPTSQAREYARSAWKKGNPSGGFMLYLIYSQDPQYSYFENGKINKAKYDSLAAQPVSERTMQIEAFEALSNATSAGHTNAAMMGLAYLAESAAPKNNDRLLGLAGIIQRSGEKIPDMLTPSLQIAQYIKSLGNSHVSTSLFRNTYSSAAIAASVQLKRIDNTACDAKQIKLTKIEAEPVSDAEYLPLTQQPYKETFLVKGNWNEVWTYEGCDKSAPIKISFSADGWSGARFSAVTEPGQK